MRGGLVPHAAVRVGRKPSTRTRRQVAPKVTLVQTEWTYAGWSTPTYRSLGKAAFITAILSLSMQSGSMTLANMLAQSAGAGAVLLAAGLFAVLLAENCRVPFDDPNTHLELTMIHEVMVLDHSGPLLGLVEYAAALKLFVLEAVLLHVMAPTASVAGWPGFALFLGGLAGVAVGIGLVESVMARLRLLHVPTLLIAAVLSCAFAFLLLNR